MERMPDDVATNILFRFGKCSQYEVKPKRPKKQKAEFKKMDVWHSQELKAAMDENAKLREFIKLKQTCWKYAGWCHSCPYNGIDEDHADCNCTVQEEVEKMARELGIEGECAKS